MYFIRTDKITYLGMPMNVLPCLSLQMHISASACSGLVSSVIIGICSQTKFSTFSPTHSLPSLLLQHTSHLMISAIKHVLTQSNLNMLLHKPKSLHAISGGKKSIQYRMVVFLLECSTPVLKSLLRGWGIY